MSKVVVFDILNGDFDQGFEVTLRIRKEDGNYYKVRKGGFPAAPNIPQLYKNFQEIYKSLGQRAIECESNQITNVSTIKEFQQAADALKLSLGQWFEHYSIGQLRVWVEEEVGKEESARIIFSTNNEIFKKLPWHLWELFQNREQAWFSLGTEYNHASEPLKYPVKILAILGSDKEINLTQDEKILINLPGAKVKPLKQPTREKLCSELRDKPWDILCYAGHSITSDGGNDGAIQLNNTDSPSLENLRNAFKKAIKNGLKLAIFNSCDGLGLASKLTELGIPQVIVMREPVPDEVAQKFLKEFLRLFSQGEKFHLAMRQAQERLEEIEHQYPYASWLPVICQNPSEKSLLWRQPITVRIKRSIRKLWREKKVIFASRVVVALLLVLLTHQIYNQLVGTNTPDPGGSEIPSPSPTYQSQQVSSLNNINERFSQGERLLLNQNQKNIDIKKQGTAAFSEQRWDDAIKSFSTSLTINQNDPEALIYLNNAIAMKKGSPLKIAVAVSTLKNPGEDEEILRGIAHAQSELNCGNVQKLINVIKGEQNQICNGGIQGKPLLVEIANDSGKEDIAVNIANYIVHNPSQAEILAVIGHNTSKLTLQTVKNEYKKNILVITPTGNSTDFNNNDIPSIVLRTVVDNSYEINDFYTYIKNRLHAKDINAIFVYQKGEAFSESLKYEFERNISSNPTYIDDTNYSAKQILDSAREKNANVLLLAPPANSESFKKALDIIKEISNNKDYENLILLGASTLYKPETRSYEFGKASEKSKLVVFTPWHRSNSDFESQASKIWGTSQINWVTAMSYDATKVVIEGLDKVGEHPNRQQLREYLLRNITSFSVQGANNIKVQFEEKGGRKRDKTNGLGVLVQVKCNSTCNFVNLDSN